MKLPLFLLPLALLLGGCSTTVGLNPEVTQSGFDNSKSVNIFPHPNVEGSGMPTGLGAQWHANDPDNVILVVMVYEYIGITGAELNIDGEKIVLTPVGTATDMQEPIPNVRESMNNFSTDLSTVEKILKSKRTWLRVYTPTGTLESAVIDGQQDSKAYHALERFMAAVKSTP
jgi:hypothetical protein